MSSSRGAGRGRYGRARRDLTRLSTAPIGRAVVGALAVSTALVLLSGCTSTPHGTIRPISAGSPTTAATTSTSAAPTPTAATTPTATPSAVASNKTSSAKPPATNPRATIWPPRVLDRKSVAMAAIAGDVVYLRVSSGHLLTVDYRGRVSMSGTKDSNATRMLLEAAGSVGGVDRYLIVTPFKNPRMDSYCLSNTTLSTFVTEICDKEDETQNITFKEVGNREFVLDAYMGQVVVTGTFIGADMDNAAARFSVIVPARS